MYSNKIVVQAGVIDVFSGKESCVLFDISFSSKHIPSEKNINGYVEYIEEQLSSFVSVKPDANLDDFERFTAQIEEGLSEIQQRFIFYKFN